MDIKYVEVPVRVKPHKEYLDMKGVDALWEQIKEYVREHGGENTQGSVNADEVNAIIAAYYAAHKDELKGEPFTFEDLTEEQIEALRGADGAPGRDGKDGVDGTVSFDELTDEQRAMLKGDKGDQGEVGPQGPEGPQGPKGADGTMTFSDLTDEQKASLKGDIGPQGPKGDTGDPFTYDMFTTEQLEALKGPQGDIGPAGPAGPQGPQGVQGIPGQKGEAAEVDYTLVYTREEVDELLKNVDLNPDQIDLSNYYVKDELYNRGQIDNLISSLVIEGAAGVHVGTDEPQIAGVSVWVDTDGVPYEGDEDLTEIFYKKDYIDDVIETHVHRLSEMENDIGFVTITEAVPTKVSQLENDVGYVLTENVYKKAETYTKTEVLTTLADYWKKSDAIPEGHTHMNKNILDKMYELNGNLMYNGIQVSGGVSDGSGTTIDMSAYALQSNVNNQIDTVANAKVDKTTYDSKVAQIDLTTADLDSRITQEAVDRANADTVLSDRVTIIEGKGYQTKADVQLLIQNAGVTGGEVEVDLTDYYTKSEVDDAISEVTELVGDESVATQISTALSDHNHDSVYAAYGHQHDNYAASTHTHDDYLLKTKGVSNIEVLYHFSDSNTEDVDYYTGSWGESIQQLLDAGKSGKYLWMCIKHQKGSIVYDTYYVSPWSASSGGSVDLTGYATETYVQEQIAAIEHPTTDLTEYYTKSEVDALIPAVSAYQTEAQVLALIQANMPASGDEVSY